MKIRTLMPVLVLAGVAGCSMMPAYEQPAAPTPTVWPQGEAYAPAGEEGSELADIGWRDFFRDPALQQLIDMALDNNRDLRSDTALLELTRNTLRTYEESLQLIELRNEAGTASQLDVTQARSAVEGARSQEAQYLRLIALDNSALQWLIGTALPDGLSGAARRAPIEDSILADIPVGLPADVMQRRPDILAAEHRLKGANANIGAARVAFFPSVTLTASAGTASSELSGLFDAGSGAWSFMPKINIPVFNAGRLRANLDYAEIQKDINVAEYEKTIQTAFREVSDGLAARKTYRQQLRAEYDLVNTNRQYLDLADQRYRAGVDNYLTVLDAQRELFTAEQQRIRSRLDQLNGEIALYKALGGGDWATAR